MVGLSAAESYLLEQVRQADAQAWQQLVSRYQGRLLAFARWALPQGSDAEDVVQETFIGLLQSLPGFRGEATLETFLFRILRRRIADYFRRRDTSTMPIEADPPAVSTAPPATRDLRSPVQTASWYARQDEQRAGLRAQLSDALRRLVDELQAAPRFEELQFVELLLGGQLRNKDVARLLQLDEKQVALRKHRLIRRLSSDVAAQKPAGTADEVPDPLDSLLSEVWADDRPTCPKRSTLGKYLLGTLDHPWHAYVQFHLEQAACPFCRANLHDLQSDTDREQATEAASRILRSTIGFFRPN